ncbi:histone-lysine N-methyltransferase SETMAR [Trichonephila clavipes]|nr:histone-lysine N-methyltransferase SETMAR [Trichonephila clavipes]
MRAQQCMVDWDSTLPVARSSLQDSPYSIFRSGDLSLCDKARTGRPRAMYNEALQAVIEDDISQTCDELARQFNTSNETVRFNLHRLGKTYRLCKRVPHALLEVHKQQ